MLNKISASSSRLPLSRRAAIVVEIVTLAAILAVYFALTMRQINLPGLHPDEAQEVIPTVQLLRGQEVETLRGSGLTIAGRRFPLMIVDYIGTVNTYLALPFFSLFGISTFSLRLMSVLTSAVTLVLLYRLGRTMYSPVVGLAAAGLLAVQPSFVFWSRQGVYVTFITAPLTLGAVWLGWQWWRGRLQGKEIALYAGAFLLGLGLAAKLLTLWVIFAISVCFAILYAGRLWQVVRQRSLRPLEMVLTWWQAGLATLSFALGASMLIVYNLQTGGTWQTINANRSTSFYGVDNARIFDNLLERFRGLKIVLTGEHLWYLSARGTYANLWWPRALVVVGVIALGLVFWRARGKWRRLLFPYLTLALMVVASIFTVSALWFTHQAIMLPWASLALAVGLAMAVKQLGDFGRAVHWVAIGLAILTVVGLMALDVRVTGKYHAALSESGGFGGHTAAVYELVEYLEAEGETRPYAMDWGIQDPVQFLSEGEINPVELAGFEFEAGADFEQRVVDSFEDTSHIYIFHAPSETIFEREDLFEVAMQNHGLTLSSREVIRDEGERPIYLILRVEPLLEQ